MLEFIALNVYTLVTIAGVLSIIGILLISWSITPFNDGDTYI